MKRTLVILSGRTSGRATLNAVERVLLVAAERNANGSVLGRLLRRADAGASRARRDGVRRAGVFASGPNRGPLEAMPHRAGQPRRTWSPGFAVLAL